VGAEELERLKGIGQSKPPFEVNGQLVRCLWARRFRRTAIHE
jgi:hypothetical protein